MTTTAPDTVLPSAPVEAAERFACFGTTCTVQVTGDAGLVRAAGAARAARRRLEALHSRFSRFLPDSELTRVSRDPRPAVPVTAEMAALAEAIAAAGALTGGLVDGTLLAEIEAAGYTESLGVDGPATLDVGSAAGVQVAASETRPAGPSPRRGWAQIHVDRAADGTVSLVRPPGLGLDSGGIAKGLFADLIAAELAGHAAWAVELGGDIRIGGTAGMPRAVRVAGPAGEIVHTFAVTAGAAATSGTGRRRFTGTDGTPAHHLLDPATGRPAHTGVVQATAIAATGVLAEAVAKAALLSGPAGAARWLRRGGVLITDDGTTTPYGDHRP